MKAWKGLRNGEEEGGREEERRDGEKVDGRTVLENCERNID